MIKPVYFGNNKEDKFLLHYVDEIDNFSNWVKKKLCEEFDVKLVGKDSLKIVTNNYPKCEDNTRKAIQKEQITTATDKIEERQKVKIEDLENINPINNGMDLNQWTL